MEYRLGTCSDCGARFKVPATFKADKAKCQKCKGVVTIGPIQSDGAPARGRSRGDAREQAPRVPSRKPAAAQAAASKASGAPAGKKRSGPSMKERLLAQRRAEAEQAAAKPASASGSRPASRRTARAADSSETRSGSGRSSRSGSARGARSGSSSGAHSAASGRRATAGSSRRRGARGGQHEEAEASPRAGYRGSRKKQKSPAPMIGVMVLALIIGFGAYRFVFQEDEPVNAGETEVAAADAGTDPMADSGAVEEPVEEPLDDPGDLADEGAGEEAADIADEAAAEEVPDPPAKKEPDPDSVDLAELTDFEPYGDTTQEEWQEMQQLMATYVDIEAGAAGRRAGNSLEEYGKKAIPVIINRFKQMDFATELGRSNGDVTQRLLMTICGGTNVGWKYSTDAADIVYNKKAVKLWHKIWDRAKDDEAYWNHIAKLGESTGDTPPPAEKPKLSDEDLDDLDALGDG